MRPTAPESESRAHGAFVRGLEAALAAHRAGAWFEIGSGWDDAAAGAPDDARAHLALTFWDC